MQTLSITKSSTDNNAQLFAIAKTYNINSDSIIKLLNVSPHTYAKWRLPPGTIGRRSVTDSTLAYFKLLIFTYQTIPLSLLARNSDVNIGILRECNISRLINA